MILGPPKKNHHPLSDFTDWPSEIFQGILFCIPHPTTWRWLFSFLGSSVDDATRATYHGFHGSVNPCPPKSNVWLRYGSKLDTQGEDHLTTNDMIAKQHEKKHRNICFDDLGKVPSSLSMYGPNLLPQNGMAAAPQKKSKQTNICSSWPFNFDPYSYWDGQIGMNGYDHSTMHEIS